MRRAAPLTWAIVACLAHGCSTMKAQHPGVTDLNPNAVVREFPYTATRVAQTMADVMSSDMIIDNVSMKPDPQSKEYRNFTRAERQQLGISLLTPANDVNYNITAKSKDGHPIAVAVRLKGPSSAEVSLLYGFSGDTDLSKDILDKVAGVLSRSPKDPEVSKTAGSKASPSAKSATR